MKIVGVILMVGCTTGLGIMLSAELGARVRELEASLSFISHLANSVRYTMAPVADLMNEAAENPCLANLRFLPGCVAEIERGASFPKAWKQAVAAAAGSLRPRDKQILQQLGDVLGAAEWESQMTAIQHIHGLLSRQLEEARSQRQSGSKMYSMLGFLSGLALAIFMI